MDYADSSSFLFYFLATSKYLSLPNIFPNAVVVQVAVRTMMRVDAKPEKQKQNVWRPLIIMSTAVPATPNSLPLRALLHNVVSN